MGVKEADASPIPDADAPAPAPSPPVDERVRNEQLAEQLAERALNAPLMAWVKDGTPTAKSEEKIEREWQQAERRRDELEEDKKVARIPIEHGGGRLFTNRMTSNADIPAAYVLLHYVNSAGRKVPPGECCADVLQEDFSDPNNLTLILVCRRCIQRKHADTSQIKIRQSNRYWKLVTGMGPRTFTFDDGWGPKTYHSAGVVVESEKFTCGYCHWRAVIDHNKIREL